MRLSLLAILFSSLLFACEQGPEYKAPTKRQTLTPEDKSTSVNQPVQGNQEAVAEAPVDEPKEEEVKQEQPPAPVDDGVLSPAEILALPAVMATGNGDLADQANAAAFATRYLGPNGKPLNDPANPLTLKVGQTLTVCNDKGQAQALRIHTNGSPFNHGANIAPGACTDYLLEEPFQPNGNNMYDHNLDAYPMYIRVVSEQEAQAIIAAEAAGN